MNLFNFTNVLITIIILKQNYILSKSFKLFKFFILIPFLTIFKILL